MVVTLLQLFVSQADAFTAKYQRNRRMLRFGDAFQTAFARIEHRPRQRAGARAGPHDEATARQRFIEGVDDVGIANDVAGPGRQSDGLRIGFDQRIDQPQVG